MAAKADNSDFYGLVTNLCRCILERGLPEEYAGKRQKILKKMRTRAFEILLNKNRGSGDNNDNQQTVLHDPSAELLKHAFVLRSTLGQVSRATKLEDVLDQLHEEHGEPDAALTSALEFLNCMKAYEVVEKNDLNIFHFGEKNPVLPEPHPSDSKTPEYQIYPSSAFQLPYKIDEKPSNLINFSNLSIQPPFSFQAHNQLELSNNEISRLFHLTSANPMLMGSTNYYLVEEGPAEQPLWEQEKPEEEIIPPMSLREHSSVLDVPFSAVFAQEVSESRNWENLGCSGEPKRSTFILESEEAIEHLQNFQQWSLWEEPQQRPEKAPRRLSMVEFLGDVKLLLLGIESDSFTWNARVGFIFRSNTTVPRMSSEALKDVCAELTHWATCFKLLSLMIRPGPESNGVLREDSLIFKAMCANVDEILIHYQAVILQVFADDSVELLALLHQLQPIGCLISEVARLCRCDNVRQTALGEGIGLLSHIYKQVTKITKPNVALVHYSVLKVCCDVYFEFLEKWIFEGKYDEAHGEFMIKIRVKYLRTRGHEFWSRCFGVNREAVPGFLENLTESILQCGKAVRLLKICDPKNPMCTLFSTSHPSVRVCLNVNMLSEQEEICHEYMGRGMEILGNVTMSSALEQMRMADKNRACYVAAAQQGALQRIKKNQEDARLLMAKNKRELLANLKNQAEEAVSRKEKAREAKILEEKLLLEKQAAEEEEEKRRIQMAETKVTIDYYKELAEEAKKRRLRALWRARRMALFDERVEHIVALRQDESLHDSKASEEANPKETADSPDRHAPENAKLEETPSLQDLSDRRDENSNSSEEPSQKTDVEVHETPTRTPRPTDLSLKYKDTSITSKNSNISLGTISLSTEAILNEISESNRLFKTSKTPFVLDTTEKTGNINVQRTNVANEDNSVVLDREGNESKVGATVATLTVDPNQNKRASAENLDNLDNVDNQRTDVDNQTHSQHAAASDLNDATPMSCTTDSYLQSVASSSLFFNCLEIGSLSGSKNDFETPMSPEEPLTKSGMKQSLPESQSFFNGFGLDTNGPVNFESSLTMADVELIDNTSLQIYLEKSVIIPLMVQSRLANSAVVKCLVEENRILSHLQSLRSFFFLLNGEFARNLTGAVFMKFYEVSLPAELFNSATLTNLLKNALHSSLNCSYENAELLSLSAIKPPTLLKRSDPEALDCLCLNYKVSWPLNIILDEALMQQYSKVFKFLVMVGRVLWVLQEDFCILKLERKATLSPQYHRLQLFRHTMMQFMTAFSNYLTCSVLHASWSELERDLENATTLDEIYSTHVSYIKKILSRCMLTTKTEKLRQCLCSIFRLILKFHNCLRSHEWHSTPMGYTFSNFTKLEQMYEAFCELRTYPAQVVEKLASSGYQSHLTHFLDSLNINPLYNLSTKGI